MMTDPHMKHRVRVLAGGVAVALVAVWAYVPRLADQPWFADESAYVAETYYYHLLFHRGDPWHEDWQREGAMQDPPVAKYLFGLAMDLAGLDVPTDYGPTFRWFHVAFTPPDDPRVLPVARTVSAVAGVIACLALYALAVRTWGMGAAVVASVLWCVNPLIRMSARRAMRDAIAECLVLLTVLLGAAVCRRLTAARVRWRGTCGLAVLLALCGALATGTKLNGAVGLLSFALMLVLTWAWLVYRHVAGAKGKGARNLLCEAPYGPCGQKVPGTFSFRSRTPLWVVPLLGVGTAALAFMIFCATNPYLLGGGPDDTVFTQTARMLRHRNAVNQQARIRFHRADGTGLFTPPDKLWAVCRRGCGSYATLHPMLARELVGSYVDLSAILPGELDGTSEARVRDDWTREHPILTVAVVAPVSALIALVGLILVGARLRRHSIEQTLTTTLPWLAYLVVTTLIVIGFVHLDWDRYYIPLMAPWSIAMGVALWALPARWLTRGRTSDPPGPAARDRVR